MKRGLMLTLVGAATLAIDGCAFVPQTNNRLEEARLNHRSAQADATLTKLAPNELRQASETFHLADTAWNTLDDSAVVDHLAYLAKQRLAIAREVARKSAAEDAARTARVQYEVIVASSSKTATFGRLAGDPH